MVPAVNRGSLDIQLLAQCTFPITFLYVALSSLATDIRRKSSPDAID